MNTKPRKLSVLLELCLHLSTPIGLSCGMCSVAEELQHRGHISHSEMWLVQSECMSLVRETRLENGYKAVCLLRSALSQRLQGKYIVIDELCYLIYSCWIDKLESEGK